MSTQPVPVPQVTRPPEGGLACPEPGCTAPAVLLDRFWLPSTGGLVAHWKTRCARGHVRTPRVEEGG